MMLLDEGFVAAILEGFEGTLTKLSGVSPLRSSAPIWRYCKPGSKRSEFR